MEIAVIGAGPVGLYTAGLLRRLYPDGHVQIFEKRSKDQLSGFGYTVHGESLKLLSILHADVINAIEQSATVPFTRRTIAFRDQNLELDPEACKKMPIIGVEYDSLTSILRNQAVNDGIELHYHSAINNLDELADSHDLVIVANGVNSAFLEHFDPMKVDTKLSYAWGKNEAFSDEMAMTIDTIENITFTCHTYPISKTTTAVIIEIREEHEADAEIKFALSPQTMKYFPDGIKFRKVPLCLCKKKAHQNVVCIGDAALAQYFAAGAGLYFGLMQSEMLIQHLVLPSGSIEEKLKAYEVKARELLRYQWGPNKSLIRKKLKLLDEYQLLQDDAVLQGMLAYE